MDLKTPVSKLPFIGNKYSTKLSKLGIEKVEDLIKHIPIRYVDFRNISSIANAKLNQVVTIKSTIQDIKNVFTKNGKRIQLAEIKDDSGSMQVVWFNQPFLVKSIKKGEKYSFSGKVRLFNNKKSLISPEYELIRTDTELIHTARLVPVYPTVNGISSKWIRSRIYYAIKHLEKNPEEFLPKEELEKLDIPDIQTSIFGVHFPDNTQQAQSSKKRLAFEELLHYQLSSLIRKRDWIKNKVTHPLKVDKKMLEDFSKLLDFQLTSSQIEAIKQIYADLASPIPMNRLLEGDVGSGKTVVAAAACFAAFVNGYQSAIMAPTQILANQHFDTLNKIFSKLKIRISLVTGSVVKKDVGKSDIFVGTHALIHQKAKFDNVALVVIDEQHKFGVEQRAKLIEKSASNDKFPNVLSMTATPIPRTVALTVYGDLDLSILKEMPKGRIPTTTWIVPPHKRQDAYNWIKEQIIKQKTQVFVICPLIEESQLESMKQIKAVKAEFENFKKIFPEFRLSLLHGKMKGDEKGEIMKNFANHNIDILISTPIVEVGVDIPNANIMIIEAGERYGLAQLHQLRGRIGRSNQKSYCLVFTTKNSSTVNTRLKALTENLSGFELAELDLKLRGPGELVGTRQHGFPQLKIANWGETDLIDESRKFALDVIENPNKYPDILDKFGLKHTALN
jgi:ATP-dependent DNA helicase RecG